jgi:hypothetical protein
MHVSQGIGAREQKKKQKKKKTCLEGYYYFHTSHRLHLFRCRTNIKQVKNNVFKKNDTMSSESMIPNSLLTLRIIKQANMSQRNNQETVFRFITVLYSNLADFLRTSLLLFIPYMYTSIIGSVCIWNCDNDNGLKCFLLRNTSK